MTEDKNTEKSGTPSTIATFSFQRMGGLDQIVLRTDEEWQNLDKLDEKLWMALSCPIAGLEFSQPTLELLDSDHDGRIRAQEVKDAVSWLCLRLRHPSKLANGKRMVEADDLRPDTEEGKTLSNALKMVLAKSNAESGATLEEIEKVLAEAAGYPFNGDGIIPPDSAEGASSSTGMRDYILKGLSIVGGKRDASGKPGLDEALAAELGDRLQKTRSWRESIKHARLPLGEKTAEAWTLLTRLSPKLDDYFCRCRLAAYSPESTNRINEEATGQTVVDAAATIAATGLVDRAKLLNLPISRVNTEGKLDLLNGLNPAWINDMQTFRTLVLPAFATGSKGPDFLDEATWETIKKNFDDYAQVLQLKPSYPLPPANAEPINLPGLPPMVLAPGDDALGRAFLPQKPDETLESLSDSDLDALLAPEMTTAFARLVEKDKAAPPLNAFQDLRKLSLYQANIHVFLMNFLSFLNFYAPDKKAIFQTGALYLDSRECLLCVPVADVETHARLAAQSHLCLVYCECSRKNTDGSTSVATIAAALTMGTLASLIEGRHGLFVDNEGKEWDTKIIKIVHNPISLREACWAPYIRITNMAGEQIQKFVAAKAKSATDAASATVTAMPAAATAPAPKQGFDFAKGAGIFAALSVAVSVLSAAFAYIAHSLVSLGWWWPLAILAIFLCISGPSMLIAWFKLRKRSLGPLLDASGWAVNKGAPINLVMGATLTTVGKLPPNAKRDLDDPYSLPARMRAKRRRTWFWIIILFLLLCAVGGFWAYCKLFGEPLWFFTLRAMLNI